MSMMAVVAPFQAFCCLSDSDILLRSVRSLAAAVEELLDLHDW
jgi:hypothetical protein